MADQIDPKLALLLARVYTELGDLEQAKQLLDVAQNTIFGRETPYWLRLRAELDSCWAGYHSVPNDWEGELYESSVFLSLIDAGRLYTWDSPFRHGLLKGIEASYGSYRYHCSGMDPEFTVPECDEIIDRAQQLHQLVFQQLPPEPDATQQLLIDYRTTLTHLCNLRSESYYLLDSDDMADEQVDPALKGLPAEYRKEIVDQRKRLKDAVRQRLADLEARVDGLSDELWNADPDLASVVTLTPRFIKENRWPDWDYWETGGVNPSHADDEAGQSIAE